MGVAGRAAARLGAADVDHRARADPGLAYHTHGDAVKNTERPVTTTAQPSQGTTFGVRRPAYPAKSP